MNYEKQMLIINRMLEKHSNLVNLANMLNMGLPAINLSAHSCLASAISNDMGNPQRYFQVERDMKMGLIKSRSLVEE